MKYKLKYKSYSNKTKTKEVDSWDKYKGDGLLVALSSPKYQIKSIISYELIGGIPNTK